jgi:hypothetical protein
MPDSRGRSPVGSTATIADHEHRRRRYTHSLGRSHRLRRGQLTGSFSDEQFWAVLASVLTV